MASVERTFHTPNELALELSLPAGWVDVETYDGEETQVVLESDNERILEDAVVELRERPGGGHTVVVEIERRGGLFGSVGIEIVIGSGAFGRSRVRLRVRCPHGASLTARTTAADVHARGSFSTADVKTVSGEVRLDDVAGDATLKTASGDVRLTRVGAELRLNTVSGDAHVERAGDTVTAQLVSGDLTILDAASSVTAKSVSGDLRLHAVAVGDVELTSVSGDIEVGVRRGSRIDVDAASVSGDLSSEVELGSSPGDGGGDGPLVVLRGKTVSGDFRVFRAAAVEQHA